MGKLLPGYDVVLLDAAGRRGEVALRLSPRPLGLTTGYLDAAELFAQAAGGLPPAATRPRAT